MAQTFYTVFDIADMLGIKPDTARMKIRSEIPHVKLGHGRLRVAASDFDAWIAAQRVTPDISKLNDD